ncbi:MAG: MotA/TolQ/ExbB proton channel family protein [Candidatus Methylomirabilales bacterium]
MPEHVTLFELIRQGGITIYPLLACSILSLAVIAERGWVLWRVTRPGKALSAAVLGFVERLELQEARYACKTSRTPVAEVFLAGLGPRDVPPPQAGERMDRKRQEIVQGLKRHLWILGTIGSSAPFIGLLGTVVGIVRSFHSMAVTGSGGFTVVAAGISEALIATAAGLVVAVVSLVAYNTLLTVVNNFGAFLRFRVEEVAAALQGEEVRDGALADR